MARMRAAERRRQLLETAAGRFARYGYRGATTADLARAAGVTEPVLYQHFDSKLALFVTLIREIGDDVIAAWRDALQDVDGPHERLRIILAGNPAANERGQGVYRVIFQAMTESGGEPEIAKAIRRHVSTLQKFIADELAGLQKAGIVRQDESADELAWMLVDVAIGFGMISSVRVRSRSRARSKEDTQRLLMDLLQG